MKSNKIMGVFIIELLISIAMFVVVMYEVLGYSSSALTEYGYKLVIPFILFSVFTVGAVKSLVDMAEAEEKKKSIMYKFIIVVAFVYLVVVYELLFSGMRLSSFKPMPREFWIEYMPGFVNMVPFRVFKEMSGSL